MGFTFYCMVWVTGVVYALWSFCLLADEKLKSLDPLDFVDGWTILQRKKDVSDIEWVVFTAAFSKYWLLLFTQVLLTQIILPKNEEVLLWFYTAYSTFCLIIVIGPFVTTVFLLYILLMWAAHFTGWKSICYIVTIASLYSFHLEPVIAARENFVPEQTEGFLVDVGLVWLAARCLSFSLDRIESHSYLNFKWQDFLLIFSYCLYMPVMFTGPILSYQAFVNQVMKCKPAWTLSKVFKTAICFYKPLYGYFLLEFLLHFVYSSAMQYYPQLVLHFSAWPLCGLGYALPILFYVKYFVIYSFSRSIAKLEHFKYPSPPKCISRTHLPSVLWRTFDRGLYLWILKYLYLPILNSSKHFMRKLCALAICFLFISLWHGKDKAVFIWATLNFFGVVIETSLSALSSSKICSKFQEYLSVNQKRAVKSLISTPQFMMMCISSIYFLSNLEIGYLVFKKIILGGMIPLVPTVVIMYCGCQASFMIKEREEDKIRMKKNLF